MLSHAKHRTALALSILALVVIALSLWRAPLSRGPQRQAADPAVIESLVRRYSPEPSGQGAFAPLGLSDLLARAFTDLVEGASGDARKGDALASFHAGKLDDGERQLRAIADAKIAELESKRKGATRADASAAFQALGAITSLRHPAESRDAFARAATLDPDNIAALIWHGWLQLDAGGLDTAQAAFQRVLELKSGSSSDTSDSRQS